MAWNQQVYSLSVSSSTICGKNGSTIDTKKYDENALGMVVVVVVVMVMGVVVMVVMAVAAAMVAGVELGIGVVMVMLAGIDFTLAPLPGTMIMHVMYLRHAM